MGLRVSLIESLDERRQSWLRESLEALASGPPASEAAYVHHLSETILSLCQGSLPARPDRTGWIRLDGKRLSMVDPGVREIDY
jgi:hypothetical protein